MLKEAGDAQEEAYAYGFLSHLAADVIAHNYFIPNLIYAAPIRRRRAHLMLEVKADYFVGPEYTKIAREVLRSDHQGCDELLRIASGKKLNGLRVKRRLFTQSVVVSDYLHATRSVLFPGRLFQRKIFLEYLGVMAGLSCRIVFDFLQHPHSSPCIAYDPIGAENLRLAREKGSLVGLLHRHRPPRQFTIDQELLKI